MTYLRTNSSTVISSIIGICMALAFASSKAAETEGGGNKGNDVSIDLAFVTHLDMDLPEQDVFIEREKGSRDVYRVTRGDNDMGAQLYKAAHPVSHNPFSAEAVGPYPKGEAIGMTLGAWLKHQGTGTYRCENGAGTLSTSFSGLIPDGVYTMWHAFMPIPATTPFSGTLDIPLGARDGSTSVFTADAAGNAAFDHTFKPCLQMSDVWVTSMLAINWHSDGNTYQAHPGDFGYNAHIPLFLMLPPREGI